MMTREPRLGLMLTSRCPSCSSFPSRRSLTHLLATLSDPLFASTFTASKESSTWLLMVPSMEA